MNFSAHLRLIEIDRNVFGAADLTTGGGVAGAAYGVASGSEILQAGEGGGTGDVAILTEHVTVDGEDKGRHFGGEFRFVRVFAKQNGNWKVVMAQGAPIPQPAADSH